LEEEIAKLVDIESIKNSYPAIFKEMIEERYNIIGFSSQDVKDAQVIDIGAHIGTFSLLCQVCGAKSIISIEANPETFKKLIVNLSKCPSVRGIINKAIFDGCIDNVNIINSDTESRITTEKGSFQDIPSVSLDKILSEQNGDDIVLKIDTEGAEYNILPACSKKLLRKCKTIFLETHYFKDDGNKLPGKSAAFLKEYLHLMGFKQKHYSPYFFMTYDDQGNCTSCNVIPNFEFLKLERE